MCGIAGICDWSIRTPPPEMKRMAGAMADSMAHRGPDDRGEWCDAGGVAAFGHRRLSIVDLSPLGKQPMTSRCGNWTIAYNGEVYNAADIRSELVSEGCRFRGRSDTEVILESCAQWGIANAVKKFTGMFAFALWDARSRRLTIVRDRLGIKPLYYGWCGGRFVFASELKAFSALPWFEPVIDHATLPLYFHYGYFPSPHCVFRDFATLPPGAIAEIDRHGFESRCPSITRYWDASDAVSRAIETGFDGTIQDAESQLESLLADSVRLRMIADVPLGAFLSGGIDSSLVAALMQAQSTSKIKTFTIGFNEPSYNESEYAAAVARHLGTDHTEMYVTPREAMAVIPMLADMYDEPFADASQIPTHLVSKLTRQHVTVALSGDGGDELFAGYTRYRSESERWARIARLPYFARQMIAASLRTAANPGLNWLMLPAMPILRARGKNFSNMPGRARFRAAAAGAGNFDSFYANSMLNYPDPKNLYRNVAAPPTVLSGSRKLPQLADPVERMMFADLTQYLPDDILVKVDRASMAVALEARVPVIDHRVVEFAWSLPHKFKHDGAAAKVLLRNILFRHVPRELVERPKMGFGVPVGQWIRNEMKDWASELLDEKRLADTGLYHTDALLSKWREHAAGVYDHERMLWTILMFEAWRRRWNAVL